MNDLTDLTEGCAHVSAAPRRRSPDARCVGGNSWGTTNLLENGASATAPRVAGPRRARRSQLLRLAAAVLALTAAMALASGPAAAGLVPRLSRITIGANLNTTAILELVKAGVPDTTDNGHGADKRRRGDARAGDRDKARGGVWRLIVKDYPNDLYRQLLRQGNEAKVALRLAERRPDRLTIELRTHDADRVISVAMKSMPPRIVLDVGPDSLIGDRVMDLETPFVLTPVELPSIEPVLPDAEYPRAPLVVPGAKFYNTARRLLRRGDLNGADDAVTDYIAAHRDGRLASPARYMHGEIQHRLARGALIRDSLRAARILEEAVKQDPASPYSLRARLMLAQNLTMAGMHADAASKYSDTAGLPEDGAVAFAFRIGGAALAANQNDARRARELMRPLWRDTVPNEIGALARFIEGSILYGERACDRVVPMLAASIRLDQRVSDRYPEADMMLAECLTQRGRLREATELYDAVVRRDPPAVVLPAARVRQGDMLFYAGDVEAARNDWLAVMGKFHAGEALGLARMRLALDPRTRPEVAKSLLDEAASASGGPAHEARYRKALLLLRRGDWLKAVRVAETLINATDAKAFVQRARNVRVWAVYQLFAGFWGQGDDAAMAEHYLSMRKWLPTHPAALRLHRAIADSFERLRLPEQVVASLRDALGRFEGTSGEQFLMLDLAEAYIRLEDGFRAGRLVKYLETYVMPNSKDLRLAEVKARAFAADGKTNEAVAAYEAALRLTKKRADRVRLMARTGQALKDAGRFEEAARVYRRCRRLDRSKELLRPPHTYLADCHFGLGDALYELGDWAAAAQSLAGAADHHPDDRRRTTARSRAGLGFRRAHKLERALEQFEKLKEAAAAQAAADLDPDSIGGPGIAAGDSAEFWNSIATRSSEDTRWDLSRAENFKRLMETHE